MLKLLYLIRYVDDIPANLDNLVILMADDIRTDKIALREKVNASLGRLLSQNYIGRSGDIYNFLTDEEQDVQRDISNTVVDTAAIVERIGQKIYADIYQTGNSAMKTSTISTSIKWWTASRWATLPMG